MGRQAVVVRRIGRAWEATVYERTPLGVTRRLLVCGSLEFVKRAEELSARFGRSASSGAGVRFAGRKLEGHAVVLDDDVAPAG